MECDLNSKTTIVNQSLIFLKKKENVFDPCDQDRSSQPLSNAYVLKLTLQPIKEHTIVTVVSAAESLPGWQ